MNRRSSSVVELPKKMFEILSVNKFEMKKIVQNKRRVSLDSLFVSGMFDVGVVSCFHKSSYGRP